jgi:hypothetical protein
MIITHIVDRSPIILIGNISSHSEIRHVSWSLILLTLVFVSKNKRNSYTDTCVWLKRSYAFNFAVIGSGGRGGGTDVNLCGGMWIGWNCAGKISGVDKLSSVRILSHISCVRIHVFYFLVLSLSHTRRGRETRDRYSFRNVANAFLPSGILFSADLYIC